MADVITESCYSRVHAWYYDRSSTPGSQTQLPWPLQAAFHRIRSPSPLNSQVWQTLLLLLLRSLSSLLLQLVNRLLGVALVAAVGLDLHHEFTLARISSLQTL